MRRLLWLLAVLAAVAVPAREVAAADDPLAPGAVRLAPVEFDAVTLPDTPATAAAVRSPEEGSLDPPAPEPSVVEGSGSLTQEVGVSVLAGPLEWIPDPVRAVMPPADGLARLASGTVVYARGDGAPWVLTASGPDLAGVEIVPQCEPESDAYGSVAASVPGTPTRLDGEPVVVCSAAYGRSGGRFTVTVDARGDVPEGASLRLELRAG